MLQHFMLLIPATAIVRCQKKPHLCYITCMDSNSRNTCSLPRMCFISLSISIHNSWNFKAGTTLIFRNYRQAIMAGV